MKPFTFLAVLVLALVALVQLARFLLGWPVIINGVQIPLWVSAVAAALAVFLAVMLWRETTERTR
jgi:hypothetical protein